MPRYPGLALLLGSAMAIDGAWIRRGTRVLCAVATMAAVTTLYIFFPVRGLPAPGDISSALGHHPSAYSLALGHMMDLTFDSFAYLRPPLLIASLAFFAGALGTFRWVGQRAFLSAALMMVLFFTAARLALVVFDPFLSSHPLAEAILRSPPGQLIINRNYYGFSSVPFYTNRDALILNGRYFNLEYGSYAPGAPDVFIDDTRFKRLWLDSQRYYLVTYQPRLQQLEDLVGQDHLEIIAAGGGKLILTNHPLGHASLIESIHRLQAATKNPLAKTWV